MPSERFDFPNAHGEKLAAVLDLPTGEPRAYALFAHCFTCGKNVLAAKRIAEALNAQGIAVLRFDFTGIGSSGASSPTPPSRPTSPILSPPPTICARCAGRRRC